VDDRDGLIGPHHLSNFGRNLILKIVVSGHSPPYLQNQETFTAQLQINGPWMIIEGSKLRAQLQYSKSGSAALRMQSHCSLPIRYQWLIFLVFHWTLVIRKIKSRSISLPILKSAFFPLLQDYANSELTPRWPFANQFISSGVGLEQLTDANGWSYWSRNLGWH